MLIVAIVSGGMDSSTLLFDLLAQGHEVEPMFVFYGQRHACERESARAVVAEARKRWPTCRPLLEVQADMPGLFLGSSQTDPGVPVPAGAYDDPTMQTTVVPNRNMLLLAMAAARAVSIGAGAVAYGAHAGDRAIYPDCRFPFVQAMKAALALCHYTPVDLLAPYVGRDKASILWRALDLRVPLGLTWTCYAGDRAAGPCGTCGACDERRAAFAIQGERDPLLERWATREEAADRAELSL